MVNIVSTAVYQRYVMWNAYQSAGNHRECTGEKIQSRSQLSPDREYSPWNPKGEERSTSSGNPQLRRAC